MFAENKNVKWSFERTWSDVVYPENENTFIHKAQTKTRWNNGRSFMNLQCRKQTFKKCVTSTQLYQRCSTMNIYGLAIAPSKTRYQYLYHSSRIGATIFSSPFFFMVTKNANTFLIQVFFSHEILHDNSTL